MILTKLKLFLCGLTAVCIAGVTAYGKSGKPLKLIENGKSDYVVIYNAGDKADKFAVKELNEIIKGTTGITLPTADINSQTAKRSGKRIIVGRNALSEKLLGEELYNSLREQEAVVAGRGDDLILAGGDNWGSIYAVYDFVENEAGYRCYAPYPGGERFVKTDKLIYSGKETRNKPAFKGFRIEYTANCLSSYPKGAAKYYFRNRGTEIDWERYGKGLSYANDIGLNEKYKRQIYGHALFYYVPPYDRKCVWNKSTQLKGEFKNHPEYFTLNKAGKRVDNAQLCFSNKDLRKLFTKRVIEAVKTRSKGMYMVGSNDHNNDTYCYCPGCLKLQKKYNCSGGPLWDYLVELCNILKKDYPGVYIVSLAYKGARQTEKCPENIIFPDNFICDAALLNPSRSVKELEVETLPDGKPYDRFENLKKWNKITKHMSYWYYGGSSPLKIYEKPAKEIRELREAGVESAGACGLGDMVFGDISSYLFFRLLNNPDLDEKKEVREFVEFKYGKAAPLMMAFIDELEAVRRDIIKNKNIRMNCDDTYERMMFIEPEQIIRWRKSLDKMLDQVKDSPVHARNVRIARTAVDCLTIAFMEKIRAAYPEMDIDPQVVIKRGLASEKEARKAGMVNKRHPSAYRVLTDMSLYANLKSSVLPEELRKYPKNKVFRYLPVQPRIWMKKKASLTKDPDAVSGWTMREKPKDNSNGLQYEMYDATARKWMMSGTINKDQIVPNKYKLYKLGVARLPMKCRLVFGGKWGSSLDIQKLGRYYDPSYHQRQFEFWASLKFTGPRFDPASKAKDSYVSCDQVFLVNKGIKE